MGDTVFARPEYVRSLWKANDSRPFQIRRDGRGGNLNHNWRPNSNFRGFRGNVLRHGGFGRARVSNRPTRRLNVEHLEERRLLSVTVSPLSDIYAATEWSSPTGFVEADSLMYFAADDGIHGRELWRTDGTPGGTYMVKDITPGPDGTYDYTTPVATLYHSALYFQTLTGLWVSDGTEEGTNEFFTITSPHFTANGSLTVSNDHLFFVAFQQGSGEQLWKSDGTELGTKMVASCRWRERFRPARIDQCW